MGKVLITQGGGGTLSDECTSTRNEVLKGYTAVTLDSDDEVVEGTLELTGDVTEGYVYSGKTFYSNDPKTKLTGTMTVNSLLSFSVAAYSGRRLLATWKNPEAATGKPYSGVYIRYNTGSYPGKTGGTQIYKGAGNNTTSGGSSSVYLDMPALNTTYYFSIYPYVTCSAGEITGDVINATRATSGQSVVSITSSRTYTVPVGYSKMDVFCVGGGQAGTQGKRSGSYLGGNGGGSGYTKTVKNIAVSSGQSLSITVGYGAKAYQIGTVGSAGTSSVSRSGAILASALGGGMNSSSYIGDIDDGGSGGGHGAIETSRAGNGGSNGGDGGSTSYDDSTYYGGDGQGTTTRAFGESNGTLYAGGGGGGFALNGWNSAQSSGGSGGGGRGSSWNNTTGNPGTANTGGGGGGGGGGDMLGGAGGTGIVLLRFY